MGDDLDVMSNIWDKKDTTKIVPSRLDLDPVSPKLTPANLDFWPDIDISKYEKTSPKYIPHTQQINLILVYENIIKL